MWLGAGEEEVAYVTYQGIPTGFRDRIIHSGVLKRCWGLSDILGMALILV